MRYIVHKVHHEEVLYAPKELFEFSNLIRLKSGEHMWDGMLRWWDNGGRNMKLDQAEYIDLGSVSRDSAFNAQVKGIRKGSKNLVG